MVVSGKDIIEETIFVAAVMSIAAVYLSLYAKLYIVIIVGIMKCLPDSLYILRKQEFLVLCDFYHDVSNYVPKN